MKHDPTRVEPSVVIDAVCLAYEGEIGTPDARTIEQVCADHPHLPTEPLRIELQRTFDRLSTAEPKAPKPRASRRPAASVTKPAPTTSRTKDEATGRTAATGGTVTTKPEPSDVGRPRLPPPGDHVGPIEIESRIDDGGDAAVFQGVNVRTRQTCAVKVLKPDANPPGDAVDRSDRGKAFCDLHNRLASFRHEHVVSTLMTTAYGSLPAAVMPLLGGETLAQRLDRTPLATDRVRELAAALFAGLSALHEHGIIHGRLDPESVWIGASGCPALFRIGSVGSTVGRGSPDGAVSQVGVRGDLHAAGSLLRTAWLGPRDLTSKSLGSVVIPRRFAAEDPTLADVIRCCLRDNPERRPASADEVLRLLEPDPSTDVAAVPLPTRRDRWRDEVRQHTATVRRLLTAGLTHTRSWVKGLCEHAATATPTRSPGWVRGTAWVAAVAAIAHLANRTSPETAPPLASEPARPAGVADVAAVVHAPVAAVTVASSTSMTSPFTPDLQPSPVFVIDDDPWAAAKRSVRRDPENTAAWGTLAWEACRRAGRSDRRGAAALDVVARRASRRAAESDGVEARLAVIRLRWRGPADAGIVADESERLFAATEDARAAGLAGWARWEAGDPAAADRWLAVAAKRSPDSGPWLADWLRFRWCRGQSIEATLRVVVAVRRRRPSDAESLDGLVNDLRAAAGETSLLPSVPLVPPSSWITERLRRTYGGELPAIEPPSPNEMIDPVGEPPALDFRGRILSKHHPALRRQRLTPNTAARTVAPTLH